MKIDLAVDVIVTMLEACTIMVNEARGRSVMTKMRTEECKNVTLLFESNDSNRSLCKTSIYRFGSETVRVDVSKL